jgi:hypothetical protein
MTDDLPEAGIVFIEIGDRAKLTEAEAVSAAKAFHGARQHYPDVPILISIGGYDDEARDLWEFPEVCRYVQLWARLTHLATPEAAALHAIPVRFAGLLGACGCWDKLLMTRGKSSKA